MGSRTGSIMIISIQCENKNAIFTLYSEMTSDMPNSAYRISVNENTLEIYMNDNSLEQQKVVVNQVKQFMRDNEFNYTMEIK